MKNNKNLKHPFGSSKMFSEKLIAGTDCLFKFTSSSLANSLNKALSLFLKRG